MPVRVTGGPEVPCPPGETVDVSAHGILVRLPAPGSPLCRGDRALLSLMLPDGALHLLGRATRSVRGDDGRWYVAVEVDEVEPLDRSRLERLLGPSARSEQPGSALAQASPRQRPTSRGRTAVLG